MAELDVNINPHIVEIKEDDSPNDRAVHTLEKYAKVGGFSSPEEMYITKIMQQIDALEEKMQSEKGISSNELAVYTKLLDTIGKITGADKKPQKIFFQSPVDPSRHKGLSLFQK